MIRRLRRLFCSIVVLGLLFAPNGWTAPAGGDYIPPPLAPQLSSDGKALHYGAQPLIVVDRPKPLSERRRIPARVDLLSLPESATATFSITYVADGGTDPWMAGCVTFPEEAKAAFNAAAAIWGNILQSSVPITISACWSSLPSDATLGYSGGGTSYRDFSGAPKPSTWYSSSLANALHGSDLDATKFDMHITYNSKFSWYYGTDGNPPPAQHDLMTVVLHEIAHGLNFTGKASYAEVPGGENTGSLGSSGYFGIYDTFMRDGSGNPLTGYASPSAALGVALTGGDLWFHGSNAMAANGGQRVKMYAPATWSSGSSYAHMDYDTFNNTPNQLMVYAISKGEAIHDPGPVATGLLKDLGWPVQSTFSLSISKSGSGSGTVSSVPSGINCGAACSASFASGTSVSLTATPAVGSTFSGWSGACSGTATSCSVVMNAAQGVTATFSIATISSLGEALDNTSLVWTTGGDAPFTSQTTTFYYGGSAARTGGIGDNQSTYLSTSVTGPGTLSFYWQVSSESGYDIFSVYLDGVQKYYWSGNGPWSKTELTIPAGTHTVKWEYVKDISTASGQDAGWVDYVVFTSATTAAAALYFPHVETRSDANGSWQTEIAIINTGDQTVTGTLRGYDDDGLLKETRPVTTLSAHGRRQIIVADEFTKHTNIRYIIFDADSTAVQGYTKFYQAGKHRAAIPAVKEVNTSVIYIPHIASNSQWWTGVGLVNTTSAPKVLTIAFNTGHNRTFTLPANGHGAYNIAAEFFNNQPPPDLQSAVITNASGVIGLELFGGNRNGSFYLDGILLTEKTASTLYYPHVENNGWWTGIVAYNTAWYAGNITITAYNAAGDLLSSTNLPDPLEGGKKIVRMVSDLGLPAQTAWFKIDSTAPLSGFELFSTLDDNQLAAYAGGGGTGAKKGVFPKIEKSVGGWTGIAFVNTEALAASVTLTAYNDAGTPVATQMLSVGGHAKVLDYAENIFSQNISDANYIAYSSDRDVVGFQLNGTSDNKMLDGLPALGDAN
jgi:hypothetical protein